MSLFKILKGDSSRIDTSVTPFHDGYAYFTPDDGGFYIDSEYNGVQSRIRVNPVNGSASTAITATLFADAWSSSQQSVTIEGVTADSNGFVGVTPGISDTQMEATKLAELHVCGQGANSITVAAFGDIPTCDIPIVVILV